MAKVRDNRTGQIFEVPDDQLGNFGLSAPTPTVKPTATLQDQPATSSQDDLPPTITGHTLQEHAAALNKAQMAGDTAAAKVIKDEYDRENDYQQKYIMPKQQAAQKVTDAKNEAKSLMTATLQNYQNIPENDRGLIEGKKADVPLIGGILAPEAKEYEAGLKGEAPALAKVFGGAGSGLRVTQAEINSWMPYFPSTHKTDAQNRADVQKLNNIMAGKFGEGFDPEILQEYGLDAKGNPVKNQGKSSEKPGVGERLVKGGVGDVVDAVKGIASLPVTYINNTLHGESPQQTTQDLAVKMGKGLVNEYGQLVGAKTKDGKPILDPSKSVFDKGGFNAPTGIDLNDALNHAIDHPVNTALDVIPIIKAAGLLKAAGTTGEAANAAEKAGQGAEGIDVANATSKVEKAGQAANTIDHANMAQKMVSHIADLVNGGGSKDYIAQNAGKEGAVPQSQILMEENILSHPTETGRIKATANALKKNGSALQDAYSNSDRIFKGKELGDTITSKLKEAGYDDKSINFIKNYVHQQGEFDLNSGDNLITMDKAWKTAQKLEQNPPKMLKNPETAAHLKQLSRDTARIIRSGLAEKVPETLPLNQKYSALRDYFDNTLSDPEGLSLNGGEAKGITGAIVGAGKSVINPILNGAYDGAEVAGDAPKKLIRDRRMKVDNPNAFKPAR